MVHCGQAGSLVLVVVAVEARAVAEGVAVLGGGDGVDGPRVKDLQKLGINLESSHRTGS